MFTGKCSLISRAINEQAPCDSVAFANDEIWRLLLLLLLTDVYVINLASRCHFAFIYWRHMVVECHFDCVVLTVLYSGALSQTRLTTLNDCFFWPRTTKNRFSGLGRYVGCLCVIVCGFQQWLCHFYQCLMTFHISFFCKKTAIQCGCNYLAVFDSQCMIELLTGWRGSQTVCVTCYQPPC